MAHLVAKNGHLKNYASYKNIGLHARDIHIILSSIVNTIERASVTIPNERETGL